MSNELSRERIPEAEIKQRIHEFIVTRLLAGEDPVNVTDSTPLVSGGVIDSLNSLKVGLFLEKAFAVKIAPEELVNPENMETIAAMAQLVSSKLRATIDESSNKTHLG